MPKPNHTHYVSLSHKSVYPAMSYPEGYEDMHPEDYRPANAAEIAAYKNHGIDRVQLDPSELPPEPVSAVPLSTPTVLTLADDTREELQPEVPGFPPPPPPPPTLES